MGDLMTNINKILIVVLSFLFNIFVVAQNLQNTTDLSQEDPYWHNAFYNTDCSIPEGTQILHYPMIHRYPEDNQPLTKILLQDIEESVSLSQWRLLQLHHQYPNALVFSEQLWSEQGANAINNHPYPHQLIAIDEIHQNLTNSEVATPSSKDFQDNLDERHFNLLNRIRNAKSFEELDPISKRVLYEAGGSLTALGLELIDRLYPTTLYSSSVEVFDEYWKSIDQDPTQVERTIHQLHQEMMTVAGTYHQAKSEKERNQVEESFHTLFTEKENWLDLQRELLFDWREQLLYESVVQVLNQDLNKDKMVIISYGAAHDFSDEFKDYHFYRLPAFCSHLQTESYALNFFTSFALVSHLIDSNTITDSQKNSVLSFMNSQLKNIPDTFWDSLFIYVSNLNMIPTPEIESATQYKELLLKQLAGITNDEERRKIAFSNYISMSDEQREQASEFLQNPEQAIKK